MILRGCRGVATARTLSCGSSCSTVPMPVRIAQARARQRWPSARAASPVIHWLSPLASAVRPSRLAAAFDPHPRPAARHPRHEADVQLARLVFEQARPRPRCPPRAAASAPCAACGIGIAPSPPRRARCRPRSPRRCTAACARCGCTARASRTASRRAGRAARARVGQRVDLGVRRAGALVPALADHLAVARRSRSRRADWASSCRGRARPARARAPCARGRRR